MKLSVSNIAWNIEEEQEIFDILLSNGVTGIEVAPTKIWPEWKGADRKQALITKQNYQNQGFVIPALQAILFAKPEMKVFGESHSQIELLAHLERVASLASVLGAEIMVFGSPKNRDSGDLSLEQAFVSGADFFQRAGAVCAKSNVKLCLEPNPSVYSCNFMTRWYEVFEMVKEVSHPGISLHLDTACIHLEGDDVVDAIYSCADHIKHFHITEPNLGDFSKPELNHAAIGKALKDIAYDGWLSIEMRRSDNPQKSIKEAVSRVTEWYG